MELRSLNDWVVKLLLMSIHGVTEVLAFGGNVKQYQVQLDPDKLLTIADRGSLRALVCYPGHCDMCLPCSLSDKLLMH
jgi:hypothetical protein